jgi:hypothetical protein
MRSTKLSSAIVAAAALLALAPAGAAAARLHPNLNAKHSSPSSTCRVTLNVAPRLITAGESVLAFGHLSCGHKKGEGAQTVTLYQHSVSSPGFTVAGTTTTDAHGFYEVPASAIDTNSQFYVVAGTAKSASKTVRVAAEVTLTGPAEGAQLPTTLRTGRANKVTFTGTVSPADAGATIVLQRQNAITGDEWHHIGLGLVAPGGTFSIAHTFLAPGDANIRVLVRSNRRNIPSASNALTYEISQAQNPQLTIGSSADPIAYGGSVTISGTAAGAPNTPVTLEAHTAHQGGFAPVAQVKTDAGGNYTFPAQSPVDSTFYRVRGAGKRSAVLYQGVKDVLTAQVSATTIQAGQTLTFTGTVAPDHTGHVIYLERQNAAGTEFNVVEVATIAAGSTYSIAHTVYNVGTSVFRVKVPGDPQNGGTASQTFTVQVTRPSSASALTPEAPGNSTQPPEGQV